MPFSILGNVVFFYHQHQHSITKSSFLEPILNSFFHFQLRNILHSTKINHQINHLNVQQLFPFSNGAFMALRNILHSIKNPSPESQSPTALTLSNITSWALFWPWNYSWFSSIHYFHTILILDTSRYRLCKWNYGIKWYRMRSSSVIHYWVYPVYVSWDLREPVDTTATSCPVTHETCDWPVVTCVLAHQRTATVTLSNERKRKLINFKK